MPLTSKNEKNMVKQRKVRQPLNCIYFILMVIYGYGGLYDWLLSFVLDIIGKSIVYDIIGTKYRCYMICNHRQPVICDDTVPIAYTYKKTSSESKNLHDVWKGLRYGIMSFFLKVKKVHRKILILYLTQRSTIADNS